MKLKLCAILFSVVLLSCQQEKEKKEKTYTARAFVVSESFNEIPKKKEDVLSVFKSDSTNKPDGQQFSIKFKDTVLSIQVNAKDKKTADHFSMAQFINTQETAVLVQLAGNKVVAPFYIVSLKNGSPEVISLNRPSNGKEDLKYTKGLEEQRRSSYVINNDFLITIVNGKVYPIKRQREDERIQGSYFLNSPDKSTLVFLTPSSLYQVNYLTNEVFNLPVSSKIISDSIRIFQNIQSNYNWHKNVNGTSFLKENADDNRIVDIKEFKH
ncbi:hypothetical protein [Pedobacter punctiformis]|uniref:Lipoprotein n=1 Tax=Pedobacter punctiformis TaxID=3004097 RepID=A0ABT4L6N8_9SPHI|nr:hypothetical protein [Pedobacter sp. HCMS5-2]MCZ4243575.1 hypothetical protein [Pedobacter sp. HCMS5-2]